jgi:hypothetical protein
VEQFRLIKVDGNPKPASPPPRVIRNRDDEETEAARDDVRVFAILLDDYHVRRSNSVVGARAARRASSRRSCGPTT